jgi:outer membrane receptor for ferrienterochelin and colicin
MKRLLCCTLLLMCALMAGAQRGGVTISGHMTDSETGETLIGAGLLVEGNGSKTGAVTNVFGYYTLTVPKGHYDMQYSYVGYEPVTMSMDLTRDTVINIVMNPSLVLKEVVVVASRDAGINSTYLGSVEVPIAQVKNTPVLFGEADVLKAIQMMPGVQGGNEGFTGLYVRGGGPDENLILLDGVPIYNVDHMMGILSVFQTEAVKKVTLYKGSFPARYNGRVSSVVDIRTNDGNMKETHGSIGIGALTDKGHIEGPIIKDKLSYSVSARGLHSLFYDPIIRLYLHSQGSDLRSINYYFYDLNGKVTWRLSDKDRFIFGAYSGRDKIGLQYKEDDSDYYSRTDLGIGWGNDIGSIRWNHIFSNRLFSNTTVAFNQYRMLMHTGMKQKSDDYLYKFDMNYNSGIRDWSARIDFDYVPDPRHLIKFGTEYIFHTFSPQILSAVTVENSEGEQNNEDLQYGNPQGYFGHDVSAWIEDDISLGDHLTLNPGLNLSFFYTDKRPYFNLQPRLSVKYSLDPGITFKAGYARMAQYVHLLSSSSVSLPMDLWVPITKDIKPVTSDQFSLGVYYDGLPGWEFSIEGYYKSIYNLLEYKEGTMTFGSSTGWEDKVEMGNGRAMGLEFMVQKTAGNFTGWLAYTLAKSDRIFPDGSINMGERFPYKYDRRHNLNINLTYKLNKRVDFNAAWSFATGGTTTVPIRKTVVEEPSSGMAMEADYVSHRNNFRLPPSHRLNVGMNVHTKKGHGLWNFSVYNVYNYMNPNIVLVNFESVETSPGNYEKKQVLNKVTILPILPSVSYTYEF